MTLTAFKKPLQTYTHTSRQANDKTCNTTRAGKPPLRFEFANVIAYSNNVINWSGTSFVREQNIQIRFWLYCLGDVLRRRNVTEVGEHGQGAAAVSPSILTLRKRD